MNLTPRSFRTRLDWLFAISCLALAACGGSPPEPEGAVSASQGALVATSQACTSLTPAHDQVLIFLDPNYSGACRMLTVGFYPTSGTLGLPNDQISSIKVGIDVRFRAFADGVYGGSYNFYYGTPPDIYSSLGGWDNRISSARVEPANRPTGCIPVNPEEIALFRDARFNSDCVILPAGSYPTPEDMGIMNDSISSIINNSSHGLQLYWDSWFSKPYTPSVPAHSSIDSLPTGSGGIFTPPTAGINDNISSILLL
jgi:hypothetical protein